MITEERINELAAVAYSAGPDIHMLVCESIRIAAGESACNEVYTAKQSYIHGLEDAMDIAWQQHKHHGREKATAYQVHEEIRKECNAQNVSLAVMRTQTGKPDPDTALNRLVVPIFTIGEVS